LFYLKACTFLDMPKSKAELIVELREQMKGTPYRMPLSHMKLHELETAQVTLAKMKADQSTAAASIPVVSSGRPVSRPVAPAVAEDDDEDAIKVPQAPAPRLKKAPLIRTAKDPENHPLGRPPKAKKEEPLTGKSSASHICNCPNCPTRK
jgi:hypothetical protein